MSTIINMYKFLLGELPYRQAPQKDPCAQISLWTRNRHLLPYMPFGDNQRVLPQEFSRTASRLTAKEPFKEVLRARRLLAPVVMKTCLLYLCTAFVSCGAVVVRRVRWLYWPGLRLALLCNL